jgi:hypothetical protein
MRRAVQLFSILVLLVGSTTAQAQIYSLTAGGAQAMIGNGLPLPIQIVLPPVGDGTNFPPLLIPPAPFAQGLTIVSNGAGDITVPPGVVERIATGITKQPTFFSNPSVFSVETAIDYSWPAASATFSHGGSPVGKLNGITSVFVGTGPGGIGGGTVIYTNANLASSFGGAALFATGAGQGTNTGAYPGSPVTVYINAFQLTPGTAMSVLIVGATAMGLQWGATTLAATITTNFPVADPGWAGHPAFGGNVTLLPNGQVQNSTLCVAPCAGIPNHVQGDKGFPWTTGTIVLSQPEANGEPELFQITGGDTRPGAIRSVPGANGVGPGNIQMVTGSLSDRILSGPNGNRGWVSLTLPEPAAMLGVTGAFLMLGLCNTVVRRRSR